jgi:uncharacterized protein
MAFHRFDVASLTATPWKNGGGTTREIACRPPGADIEGFDWRVSIANIERPGPFSAFEGMDRVIMLLEGAGVRLRSRDGTVDHALDVPHAPFGFAGDLALDGELLGGPSTDFNVMTRRGRLRAEVCVLRGSGELAPADSGLLLALRGRWQVKDAESEIDCAPGEGLWWDGGLQPWQLAAHDTDAVLVAVRFEATSGTP